ncbi:hypothetical protein ABNF72_14975 [Paenibacillus larvae]|nr:hypothetical protein [Paenibacillus larvae]MDT2193326.1 hypothetical protein [Paenibacillus larvae]MDT2236570.1 hypothetical protein [Paenibacillus larvae]MDT2240627.1 hypothetical protein [Paenibacillus larvae]MDT2247261.1 hypothetical protein [Paenibacillus larvae]MDT2255987.1 hypothetical protein [Paenibacillus larvae]
MKTGKWLSILLSASLVIGAGTSFPASSYAQTADNEKGGLIGD